jgi:hypothetical protein
LVYDIVHEKIEQIMRKKEEKAAQTLFCFCYSTSKLARARTAKTKQAKEVGC